MNKHAFSILLFSLAISQISKADVLCGVLDSHVVPAVCAPNRACTAHVTLSYTITPVGGEAVAVSTQDYDVSVQMQSLLTQSVCAEGTKVEDGFQITSFEAL